METLVTSGAEPGRLDTAAGFDPQTAAIPTTDLRAYTLLEEAYNTPAAGLQSQSRPGTAEQASSIPLQDLRTAESFEAAEAPAAGKRLGRTALMAIGVRAATEVVGIGVDAALMGAGEAGVGVLQSVVNREVAATVPEIAVLDKFLPHEQKHTELPPSRLRRLGFMALGVGTAIVAQKAGAEFVSHAAANLDHGAIQFAAPLATKVGATSALNAVKKRVLSR